MTRYLFCVFCFLFLIGELAAQEPSLMVKDDAEVMDFFKRNYERQKLKLDTVSKDQIEYVSQQYLDRYQMQVALLRDGQLLLNSPLQMVVEEIFNEILVKNDLEGDYRVFVTDELVPNAYNTGDGAVFITIGLLERLHTKEEVSFVLCHEMSHEIRSHVNNTIARSAHQVNNKTFEKEIKKMAKRRSEQAKLEMILVSKLADSRKFSRALEFEADSLGFQFYSKLGYDSKHVTSVLRTLDAADEEPRTAKFSVERICELAEITKLPNWTIEATISSLGYDTYEKTVIEEEFKTHPDIPKRLANVKRHAEIDTTGGILAADASFEQIRRLAEFEVVDSWLDVMNVGRVFFRAAQLDAVESSIFTRSAMSIAMSYMAIGRREKQLGNYLTLENVELDQNYNDCLHFLNELSSSEMAAFADKIIRNSVTPEDAKKSEYALLAYALAAYVNKHNEESQTWVNTYLEAFPEGRFVSEINYLNTKLNPQTK